MKPLDDVSVLVVEDEVLLALALSDMVGDLGGTIAGTATRLAQALEIIEKIDFDLAILDINLNGERVDPLAEALDARSVPMVFTSGYGESGVAPAFKRWPTIGKPYTQEQLTQAITTAFSLRRS